jgi:dTDP-glucose pyrophosphorylase
VIESDGDLEAGGLLIASCDTLVQPGIGAAIDQLPAGDAGLIQVTEAPGEEWSFVRLGTDDLVAEVAEKRRISSLASTGLYYFSDARDFVEVGRTVLASPPVRNGEYYIMDVYAQYLKQGARFRASRAAKMWDMGNPAALSAFYAELRSNFLSRALTVL